MDPITALTIGSLLVNTAGNIFSRPKKRNFNASKIFPAIKQGVLESTEAITTPIRQNAGEAAQARGLTGGAAAQVVAQAEAPVRASAASKLSDAWTQLKLQEEQSRYQDSQNQRDWWGQMFGDIAGGGAALATGMVQKKYDDRLLSILSGDAGGTGGVQKPAVASGNKLGLFGGKPIGVVAKANSLKQNGIGGTNAMSFMMTQKRRNLNNQSTYNPFSFGIGQFGRE